MKLKENNGSALVLAILAMALLLIFITAASSQINNQIRSNKNSYEDMKYKYMAEAGIEKAIYDIEKDIKEKVNYKVDVKDNSKRNTKIKEHKTCPKVEFKNGMPVIGHWTSNGNNFSYLIYMDIIHNKSNSIYNAVLQSNLVSILGENHSLLKDGYLRLYYEQNIRNVIESISNGLSYYNHNDLESNINTFIKMLDDISRDIDGTNDGEKNQALKGLNEMKEYMIEIKCRLGMLSKEDNPQINEDVIIKLPEYTVKLIGNNELEFINSLRDIEIFIERDERGELQNIDLSNLNSQKIVSRSGNKTIEAKIEFIFTKNGNDYNITQKVISYEQKQN